MLVEWGYRRVIQELSIACGLHRGLTLVTIRILGPIELTGGKDPREILSHPRDLALLAYLTVRCGDGAFCSRDQLLAVFWPESDAIRARNALKQGLHRIRSATAHDLIIRRGAHEIGLNQGNFDSDVRQFHVALSAQDRERALTLYRGELLEGLHIPNAGGFEPWLERERSRLANSAVTSSRLLREDALVAGQFDAALRWSNRAAELSRNAEADIRRLLEVLVMSGDRASAVRRYGEYQRWLMSELELSPAPSTAAVINAVRDAGFGNDGGSVVGAPPVPQLAAPFPSENLVAPTAATFNVNSTRKRDSRARWYPWIAASLLVSGAVTWAIVARPTEITRGVSDQALAFYERGKEYIEAGREKDRERNWRFAVDMLERAIKEAPNFADAHAALGLAHLRLFHWGFERTTARQALSLASINRSLTIDEDNRQGLMARGWYYEWSAQDHERALVEAKRVLRRHPNDADAVTLVFAASRRLGKAGEAIPFMEQAVALSSQTVSLRRELASTYIGLREYPLAMALLEQSLSLFPEDPGLYQYKWRASVLQSGLARANAVLREAKDAGLSGDATWSMEFDQSWLSRNFEEALRLLDHDKRESFHMQAGDFPTQLLYGMVHRLAGRQKLAEQAYRSSIPRLRQLIQRRPADPWNHGWLAVALAGAGERDSALQQLQLVRDLTSLTPDPWANPYLGQELLLQAYLLAGEKNDALELLGALLESRHYGAVSREWIKFDPRLDPLRNDPRFEALVSGTRQTASHRVNSLGSVDKRGVR